MTDPRLVTRMIWILTALSIILQVSASNLLNTVKSLEANKISLREATQRFTSELSNSSECDLTAVERFSSYLITRKYKFEPDSDEVTFMNAVSEYFAKADEKNILNAQVELLYTTLLYPASGKESLHCKSCLSASNVTIKTLSSQNTKTRFLKLASDYISNDLGVFAVPFYVLKAEFLPQRVREIAFKAYSEKLLRAIPPSGPFPLNHLFMFTLLCVRYETPLPISFLEAFPTLMLRSQVELKHVPLYFLAQSLQNYILQAVEKPNQIRAILAGMKLLMTDIALETASKPEHIEKFSDFFAFAITHCPEEYHRLSSNIINNAQKFQEIDTLRLSIIKIARIVSLLRKSDHSIKLSCLEKLEVFVNELAETFPMIKASIENVLNDLITTQTMAMNDTSDPSFELKLVVLIRATLLQIRLPGLDDKNEGQGYGNIIFSLGILVRLAYPKTELGKQYLAMITDEYIEMCFQKHMLMYTEADDSISAKPAYSNNFVAFIKQHSNKDWVKQAIQRFFCELIRCSRLTQTDGLSEPVYQIALKHPEVDPRVFWALFLELSSYFFDKHSDYPGKNCLMEFAIFIASENILSKTEKVVLAYILELLVHV